MKRHLLGFTFLISALSLTQLSPTVYANTQDLLKEGTRLWEEKSYKKAIGPFQTLRKQPLPEEVYREVTFKLADCLWRSDFESRLKEAETLLKKLIDSRDHDRWWAEANESLAHYYLKKDQWSHPDEIKQFLQDARDYWAGATDLKLARKRFIKVSFALGDFITSRWGWYYTGIQPTKMSDSPVPVTGTTSYGLDVLYSEILKVAKTNEDKAKAHYSLAMSHLQRGYGEKEKKLIKKHFLEVINNYFHTEWLDDAHYQLGQYYERFSEFKKALSSYRELLSRFRLGESRWVDDTERRIKDITSPHLTVSTPYVFLPDSEVQFSLNWRNVSEAQFTLYKLNLVEQMQFNEDKPRTDSEHGTTQYSSLLKRLVEKNQYRSLPQVLSWRQKLIDEGKHIQRGDSKGLAEWRRRDKEEEVAPADGKLSAGAYLLLVTAGGKKAYDLVLVTDMGLVTKTAGRSALFFAFDSKTGEPQGQTQVKYHYRYYDDTGHWVWDGGSGVTDENGLLSVRLKQAISRNYNNQHNLFVVANKEEAQAFSQGNYYHYNYSSPSDWWLYAFSDRPAYRPNETISFKGILRKSDGTAFSTPSRMRIKAKISDARGNQVKEAEYTLNDYGTFFDELTLDENAALGEYRINIWTQDFQHHLADAVLFRLEEYKLPEFLVNIKPKPQEDAEGPTRYRLGDTIEVELDAQYYFGGAVADAEVEYLIYQSPYYHQYYRPRKYAWYYHDLQSRHHAYGHGTLIKQEKVKTDSEGKAVFSFETPEDSQNDLKYHIEARVVDQSRREIRANADIKVTRHSFYAYVTPKQNVYRPGDKVAVDIKTITANEDPVAVEGKVVVLRNWWRQPVVKGSQVITPGGYDGTELFTKFVKTDEQGKATFEFEPDQDGYYVLQFTGYDEDGEEVMTTGHVYVCTKQSEDIGLQYSGLTIVAEKDTYTIGETARFMLVADRPGTWVLFSTEVAEILDYQMIHLTGPVKLIEVPIKDSYTPNVFFNAISANDYQLKTYTQQIVVPPEEKFLNIKITSDKETYRPREEGQFEIEVTDKDGKPVVGEVALGIVDKSVYYIQSEYAQDIRQYFYGQKRQHAVQTQSSFYQKRYEHLVRSDENGLITEGERRRRKLNKNIVDQSEVLRSVETEHLNLGLKRGLASSSLVAEQVGVAGALRGAADEIGEFEAGNTRFYKAKQARKEVATLEEKAMPGQDDLDTPEVRTDFRSTVLWQPAVVTDENGRAKVTATFPDSLTTWTTTARVITPGTTVGTITHESITNKDIIIRLQAPRFFTERDKVTISANVHNYTDQEQKIKVSIQTEGLNVTDKKEVWVTIPPAGEERVDWQSLAGQAGQAKITVLAQAKDDSDAMQRTYPVIPHGIEKFIASAIVLKGDGGQQTKSFSIDVPRERIPESTSLQINFSPSMAAAMLDALPYLADYPYGCVEQTMSRFLPSVIVGKTMRDLGLTERQVMAYISDVLEPRGDPKGHPQRRNNITMTKLDRITKDGLKRLYDFQHSDGGWGWWKEDNSDRFMTAYVVWGLTLARDAGIKVKNDALSRGIKFLQKQLVEEEDNPDMLAWMLHALSQTGRSSRFEQKQSERLWAMRDDLNPYTRALYALSEYNYRNIERAQILARNLGNGLQEDQENGTAHWGKSGVHYRWSEGGVEATAFGIKALSNIDPTSAYLEPAVKWMALNRRGARWKNTRDTAIAILGLADYLKTTTELNPDYTFEVFVNGRSVRKGKVNAENVFTFSRRVELPNEALRDGDNEIKVTFNGRGALYLSAYLKYFTLEEDITPAGNEIFVSRKYFTESIKETLLKGYTKEWKPLKNGDAVTSGQRVKVEITLEAKNHYEYLVVEDYKPAGFEAVELKSGSGYAKVLDYEGEETSQQTWLYQEFRDQKVSFFITKLAQGKHKITYELRAEVPGEFHGMPNQSHAMYVPEIRANSDEIRFTIHDRE